MEVHILPTSRAWPVFIQNISITELKNFTLTPWEQTDEGHFPTWNNMLSPDMRRMEIATEHCFKYRAMWFILSKAVNIF